MLRKLILGGSSWMLLGAAASAADLPAQTKVLPATVPSWAGFYLGVHGGYGWGENSFREHLVHVPPFPFIDGPSLRGALAGAHAGYNWQYGRAVSGLEIDWSAADISGNSSSVPVFVPGAGLVTADRFDRVKYLGTVRGRLGWLPADNVLLYGTAGVAWERVDQTRRQTVGAPTNTNLVTTTPFDRLGWVAGVGVEAMPFGPNWIGRLEYLHYDFGATQSSSSVSTSSPGGSHSDRSGRQSFEVLRAGLSYKFGIPADVNAAYARGPATAVAASWAGFYLGAHAGYGWGENNFTDRVFNSPPVDLSGLKLKGGVYGGHAGYNWQFDRTVAGFELDLSATDISGRTDVQYAVPPANETQSRAQKGELLGSLRARLGWSPLDNVLLYGTAGLGWERLAIFELRSNASPAGSFTSTSYGATDRFGWVAGVGAETILPGGNWIGRLEYLHYGFGTIGSASAYTNAVGTTTSSSGNHDVDLFRAGLSYRFGGPAGTPLRHAEAPLFASSSSWAGFYLGSHVGYGWSDNDFTHVLDPFAGAQFNGIQARGWLAGGQAGYNWQYGRVVAGLEVDFSFADLNGSSNPVTQPVFGATVQTDTVADKIKYLATARARLGWEPRESVLLYATAGPAWARMERISTLAYQSPGNFQITSSTEPTDKFGGVVGAGAEWMPFGPNWIGRVEYLHYDFGKVRDIATFVTNLPGAPSFAEHQGRHTIEVVRAGLSYKFQ